MASLSSSPVRSPMATPYWWRTYCWMAASMSNPPHRMAWEATTPPSEITTGLPKTVVLAPEEVRDALRDLVELIVDTVVGCLAESPPELAQDIIYEGIHLVGGGAMLRGLANRLADETEVPVHLVATPLECVVLGAGLCLDSFDSLRPIFAAAES